MFRVVRDPKKVTEYQMKVMASHLIETHYMKLDEYNHKYRDNPEFHLTEKETLFFARKPSFEDYIERYGT